MKSKKKLLLMGVGVMGALAMGVGATSTFAWFQATQTARLATNTDASESSLSVTNPTYSLTSNLALPVVASLAPKNAPTSGLELAHWFWSGTGGDIDTLDGAKREEGGTWETTEDDATGEKHYAAPGLYKAFWDPTDSYLTYGTTAKTGYALFLAYELSITVNNSVYDSGKSYYTASDGSHWTVNQIAKQLADENITITLARDSSRAMFFSLSKSSTVVTAAAKGADSLTLDSNLTGIYTADNPGTEADEEAVNTIKFEFGIYVEGVNGTVHEAGPISGNFGVTIEHKD